MKNSVFGELIDSINAINHHGYIIECKNSIYRHEFAKEILKGLVDSKKENILRKIENENFLDVIYIQADAATSKGNNKTIRSEHIASIYDFLKFSPIENENRYVFIEDGEKITLEGNNKLLKTLEEPPLGSKIIIVVDNCEMLLETIKSRCVILKTSELLYFENAEEENIEKIGGELFRGILEKRELYYLFSIIEKIGKDRESGIKLVNFLEKSFYNQLMEKNISRSTFTKKDIFSAVSMCEEARRQIAANVVLKYALKNLIIKIRR